MIGWGFFFFWANHLNVSTQQFLNSRVTNGRANFYSLIHLPYQFYHYYRIISVLTIWYNKHFMFATISGIGHQWYKYLKILEMMKNDENWKSSPHVLVYKTPLRADVLFFSRPHKLYCCWEEWDILLANKMSPLKFPIERINFSESIWKVFWKLKILWWSWATCSLQMYIKEFVHKNHIFSHLHRNKYFCVGEVFFREYHTPKMHLCILLVNIRTDRTEEKSLIYSNTKEFIGAF